mmetsp:Transcript_53919/g.135514  ORF Transcript_53919/g.135514 Transcript_53919/m.135514 type:complete len:241 (+) Transcript_53919:191-913(+)
MAVFPNSKQIWISCSTTVTDTIRATIPSHSPWCRGHSRHRRIFSVGSSSNGLTCARIATIWHLITRLLGIARSVGLTSMSICCCCAVGGRASVSMHCTPTAGACGLCRKVTGSVHSAATCSSTWTSMPPPLHPSRLVAPQTLRLRQRRHPHLIPALQQGTRRQGTHRRGRNGRVGATRTRTRSRTKIGGGSTISSPSSTMTLMPFPMLAIACRSSASQPRASSRSAACTAVLMDLNIVVC